MAAYMTWSLLFLTLLRNPVARAESTALKTETPMDAKLLMLEDELRTLTSNTTKEEDSADIKSTGVAVERNNRAVRPTSGRRYTGSGNTTIPNTGSGRWRARGRQRQRFGAGRKLGRQRGRNRGRKFRGKGRNRMRTQTTKIAGSGRRLEAKNRTRDVSDQEQSDSRYNELSMSVGGGQSSAEGREEMTNTLESAAGYQYKPKDRQQQYQLARSCGELRCRRGGYCVVDVRQGRPRARCQCPLGTKGRQCETDVIVRFPKFDGSGYLALPVLRGADQQFVIDIDFRPDVDIMTSSNATPPGHVELLLFSSDRDDAKFDFFSVTRLQDGHIEFRYDCGSGMATVRSKNTVNVGKWNHLTVRRRFWKGFVRLNNGPETGTLSKGLFSRMTFRRELFLGGFKNISKPSPKTGATRGFIGCVKRLLINNKDYDMRKGSFVGDTLYGINIDECSSESCDNITCYNGGTCVGYGADSVACKCPLHSIGAHCESMVDIHIPSFSGRSYLQYLGLRRALLAFANIELVFKATDPDGLILYNGYATDGTGDFISLALRNGTLEYRFDLGTGPAVIRTAKPITLNEWHLAHLWRHGRKGILQLDGKPTVNGTSRGAFTQLTLTLDLFLGGHRNFDEVARNAEVGKSFRGCIQKLTINERVLDLVTGAISGVNVDDCRQHPCSARPCLNGGLCVPVGDAYRCQCPIGFNSANCQVKTARYRYRYRYKRHADE